MFSPALAHLGPQAQGCGTALRPLGKPWGRLLSLEQYARDRWALGMANWTQISLEAQMMCCSTLEL